MERKKKTAGANAFHDLKNLNRIIPDKDHREGFLHLIAHLEADRAAMVLLKGHLVIEEKLTESIEKSVFHPDHLDGARLTFAQKLAICRSLS